MPTHYVYIDLPSNVKDKLEVFQRSLEDEAKELQLDKISVRYAHVTLGVFKLSEETKKKSMEELTEIAAKISSDALRKAPRINIRLNGLGQFGGRVLFIEIERSEELLSFRESLISAFDESGMMSIRDFHPHVTLFKMKKSESDDEAREEEVGDLIAKTRVPRLRRFSVSELYFRKIGNAS